VTVVTLPLLPSLVLLLDGGRRVGASWDLDLALIGGVAALHHFVAYWGNNGQRSARRLNRYAVNDPLADMRS